MSLIAQANIDDLAIGFLPERNTKAYKVRIGRRADLAFSYETCIAVRIIGDGWYRRKNQWGPTTGKHFKEMVPDSAKVVDDDEFCVILGRAVYCDIVPTTKCAGALIVANRIVSGDVSAGEAELIWAKSVVQSARADAEQGKVWIDLEEAV